MAVHPHIKNTVCMTSLIIKKLEHGIVGEGETECDVCCLNDGECYSSCGLPDGEYFAYEEIKILRTTLAAAIKEVMEDGKLEV